MSIMLEPEEVDDGYFIPVASTTLASIFKDDSTNDAAVNPSLKYRPPQPKKTEQKTKHDDPNAAECVFSCSIIAYEWIQGAHTCKGKVGFAIMRIAKTGSCKIILYSPDKFTLSCITIAPQLEVTLKGAMISLYDDHKKYWGLCFNDKIIDQVKELLEGEHVIIKQYVNPDFQPEIENVSSDDIIDNTDSSSSMTEDNTSTAKNNNKASILNRIANVGHAILPSLPGSPIIKSTPVDVLGTPGISNSENKLNVLPDLSHKSSSNNIPMQHQDLTNSIAVQTGQNDTEMNSATSSNIIQAVQMTSTTVPLINNQIFTYVNGYMVPLHMQVPVVSNVDCADTSADIELIIQKLTHLKGAIKTLEMNNKYQSIVKEVTQPCICKSYKIQSSDLQVQNDNLLKKISDLELLIKEKDDFIVKHKNELQNEIKKEIDTIINNHQVYIKASNEQMEKLKQELNMKNEELKQMIPKKEADMVLANTVKILMNNTFRALASNFDNCETYNGDNVKAILAAVIKKNTVESLSTLLSNNGTSNTSTKPDD